VEKAPLNADAWEAKISDYLDKTTRTIVLEVAMGALFIDTPKLGRSEQRRITAAFERLGWVRGARTKHDRPWVRASPAVRLGLGAKRDCEGDSYPDVLSLDQ
jgi:predicted P-loop ATPase